MDCLEVKMDDFNNGWFQLTLDGDAYSDWLDDVDSLDDWLEEETTDANDEQPPYVTTAELGTADNPITIDDDNLYFGHLLAQLSTRIRKPKMK
jgi:hypothetical protein